MGPQLILITKMMEKIFNGSIAWYDYLGVTILGGAIGVVKITRELNRIGIMPPSIYKVSKGDLRFTKLTETRRQMLKNYDIESWNTVTIGAIIRDVFYVGDMENHKYEVKNYKTKKCTKVHKEEHIIVRNTREPIISRSDFEHV